MWATAISRFPAPAYSLSLTLRGPLAGHPDSARLLLTAPATRARPASHLPPLASHQPLTRGPPSAASSSQQNWIRCRRKLPNQFPAALRLSRLGCCLGLHRCRTNSQIPRPLHGTNSSVTSSPRHGRVWRKLKSAVLIQFVAIRCNLGSSPQTYARCLLGISHCLGHLPSRLRSFTTHAISAVVLVTDQISNRIQSREGCWDSASAVYKSALDFSTLAIAPIASPPTLCVPRPCLQNGGRITSEGAPP
jgi:hypothetical protein